MSDSIHMQKTKMDEILHIMAEKQNSKNKLNAGELREMIFLFMGAAYECGVTVINVSKPTQEGDTMAAAKKVTKTKKVAKKAVKKMTKK